MLPFLKSVACAYAGRYADLSEFCFLFPNKRSGTFFLKYLHEQCAGRVVLAPEIMSVAEFVARLSGRAVASRLDLIFLLFEAYREILRIGEEEDYVEFDSFRGWGETVLSDFREVDLYMCNPDEVFKNVKDYREIASNFLTEEQRRVMSEYFGREDFGDSSAFWKNFDGDEDGMSEVKKRFLHLWRIMAPLYRSLEAKLEQRGLATSSGAYRLALAALREKGREALPYKKVIAVGFNALSMVENAIFSELQGIVPDEGIDSFADFYWDATGPVLSGGINSASKFVKANMKFFPSPEWARPIVAQSDKQTMPDRIRVIASPSNSGQVKIAGTLLSQLRDRLDAGEIKDAKVAVVLPDENLLLPMLYSLPEGMGEVNLTMGYPLRLTSVVAYVTLLRRMLHNSRLSSGDRAFYHRDIRLWMAHPFSHSCFGSAAVSKINGFLDTYHKSVISLDEIGSISSKMESILRRFSPEMSPHATIDYLDSILMEIVESLPAADRNMIKSRLETSHIEIYRDALHRLREILEEHPIKMKPSTTLRLTDQLLARETVGFEGEPLTGLQVMGMLETRSIDFDHIIILSANERILPMRARMRSFIPDSLRKAFGMPPSNYAESIFSYYFYRMISRAKGVALVYDARSGKGLRTGDVSRYLLQLRHLFAPGKIIEEDWKFRLSGKEPHDPSIEKTPEILASLEAFSNPQASKEGGDRLFFSASSLNSYRECQVRFYFQRVMGIDTDAPKSEYIDAITVGNILHDVMMQLYLPEGSRHKMLETPAMLSKEYLRKVIDDKERLWQIMTRTVNRLHFRLEEEKLDTPLRGGAKIIAGQISRQALRVVRHDYGLAPFYIHGCEISETLAIPLPSGRTVNFKFAIDRLDEIEVGGKRQLRIVDYKTGRIKLEAADFYDIFNGDYSAEQVFQLFTYAWLLQKRGAKIPVGDVRLEIYDVNKIHTGKVLLPKIEGVDVKSYGDYAEIFNEGMERMLEGVFSDPKFKAVEDEEACVLCRLKTLCRR